MANDKDFKVKNGIQPTVYHESLGTVTSGTRGYYLLGGSYTQSADVSNETTVPVAVSFKTDGSIMYVLEQQTDKVLQYALGTDWDISTASYTSASPTLSQDSVPRSFTFKPDGTKMYMAGNNDRIYQYSLSPAWDVSTASYDSVNALVSGQATDPQGIVFKPDGTRMYITDNAGRHIEEYTLSAWNLSTLSHSYALDVSNEDTIPLGLAVSSDGTEVLYGGAANDKIFKYTLTTEWDLSTASYSGESLSVGVDPAGIAFSSDGTKMYLAEYTTNDVIYEYSTSINTATLDLSTGNVFNVAPTVDTQIVLSNPPESGVLGTATAFVSSEADTNVDSVFNITKYVGTGVERSITTNLDMATDGGLVWLKDLTNVEEHNFQDTEGTGVAEALLLPNTSAAIARVSPAAVTSFDTDGFSLGTSSDVNQNTSDFVAFSFKKAAGFFDIQTWTGNATAGRTISHNLNDEIGFMVVKSTSDTSNWVVYHRGLNGGTNPEQYSISLESAIGEYAASTIWNDTAPTTTEFTVGTSSGVNFNTRDYVAYIFAHNEDADSPIKCGYYTGNGSASGPSIDLGWEPQWLMIKKATDLGTDRNWWIFDKVRGLPAGSGDQLITNSTAAESGPWDFVDTTSTGFTLTTTDDNFNTNNYNYIYVAIRNPFHPTLSYDSDIQFEAGTAPTAAGNYETDVITFVTRDGGTTYTGFQAIDGAK